MGTALHLFGTSGAILSFAAAVGLLSLLVPRGFSRWAAAEPRHHLHLSGALPQCLTGNS